MLNDKFYSAALFKATTIQASKKYDVRKEILENKLYYSVSLAYGRRRREV
jgi:hypothetical protein